MSMQIANALYAKYECNFVYQFITFSFYQVARTYVSTYGNLPMKSSFYNFSGLCNCLPTKSYCTQYVSKYNQFVTNILITVIYMM